jgi:hypothetical protein
MSAQRIRRLWFVGFFFLLPWSMVIYSGPWVPAVRFLILGSVAGIVAVAEGAAGPVSGMVFLFLAHAVVTTIFCWVLASIVARLLSRLPERLALRITFACLAAGLAISLLLDPYLTPFGRAARGGLLEILS